jgi:ankyrin repeat protein
MDVIEKKLQQNEPIPDEVLDIFSSHKDEDGNTTLIIASSAGYINLVQRLLKNPKTDVNAENNKGQTALLWAIRRMDFNILKLLLENPNIDVNAKNKKGKPALIHSILSRNDTIVEMMLNHPNINVNIQDDNGQTALIMASKEGYNTIVKLLLKTKDIDVNIQDNAGHTALIYASFGNHKTIVEQLLKNNNIDVNIQDNNENTALSIAIYKKYTTIVELLQEKNIKLTTKYIDNGKILKFNPSIPEDKNFCSDKERLKTDDIFIFNVNKIIYCYSRDELKLIKEGLLENKLSKYQLEEIDDILEEYECNNDIDPITQESVSSIPKDRLSYLENKHCYDNYAISEYIEKNNSSPLNPLTRQPINKETIKKIYRQNRRLDLFKE